MRWPIECGADTYLQLSGWQPSASLSCRRVCQCCRGRREYASALTGRLHPRASPTSQKGADLRNHGSRHQQPFRPSLWQRRCHISWIDFEVSVKTYSACQVIATNLQLLSARRNDGAFAPAEPSRWRLPMKCGYSPTSRSPEFGWFVGAEAVSMIGNAMTNTALYWLAIHLAHGHAVGLSFVAAAQFLPMILLSRRAGLLAGQHWPGRVLAVTTCWASASAARRRSASPLRRCSCWIWSERMSSGGALPAISGISPPSITEIPRLCPACRH